MLCGKGGEKEGNMKKERSRASSDRNEEGREELEKGARFTA